ncbi:MFS transporter [Oryzibacter oryziterrae]|uniref:MFS transporter n=1 Tax=Oryzibacter oryziterrae TaxID=2766474 RepID=UPI001F39C148|nr:MFS transporter [Oryzibacter oryziterrae]
MSAPGALIALLSAQTLSIAGTSLSAIALPWLVLSTTGSPLGAGLMVMTEMLPYVVAKALSGPLIDRFRPARVSLLCDLLSAVALSLIPLMLVLGNGAPLLLMPVVFVTGLLRGPSDAAKQSLVPQVARRAGLPLERVTGLAATVERLAATLGTAGAGLLIAALGPVAALGANAACFLAGALIVGLGLRIPPAAPPPRRAQGYLDDLRDGARFLAGDAVLASIALMVALTNLLDQAFQAVLLPVWVREAGHGADLLGWLLAAFTGGSIAGAAVATAFAERLPRLPVYTLAFLVAGLPRFAVFTLAPPSVAVIVLIVCGMAGGFLNPILGAVMFERMPPAMTGRLTALFSALCWSLIPFGGLLGGTLVSTLGTTPSFLATGVAYALVTLMPLIRPSFRAFARPADAPPPGSDVS